MLVLDQTIHVVENTLNLINLNNKIFFKYINLGGLMLAKNIFLTELSCFLTLRQSPLMTSMTVPVNSLSLSEIFIKQMFRYNRIIHKKKDV